jgi:hypothetical protein
MYRAIRMYNGGETVTFTHFESLRKAYEWLIPSLEVQKEEGWHLRVFPNVREIFEIESPIYITIGWNESELRECTLYIQQVQARDDAVPRF